MDFLKLIQENYTMSCTVVKWLYAQYIEVGFNVCNAYNVIYFVQVHVAV